MIISRWKSIESSIYFTVDDLSVKVDSELISVFDGMKLVYDRRSNSYYWIISNASPFKFDMVYLLTCIDSNTDIFALSVLLIWSIKQHKSLRVLLWLFSWFTIVMGQIMKSGVSNDNVLPEDNNSFSLQFNNIKFNTSSLFATLLLNAKTKLSDLPLLDDVECGKSMFEFLSVIIQIDKNFYSGHPLSLLHPPPGERALPVTLLSNLRVSLQSDLDLVMSDLIKLHNVFSAYLDKNGVKVVRGTGNFKNCQVNSFKTIWNSICGDFKNADIIRFQIQPPKKYFDETTDLPKIAYTDLFFMFPYVPLTNSCGRFLMAIDHLSTHTLPNIFKDSNTVLHLKRNLKQLCKQLLLLGNVKFLTLIGEQLNNNSDAVSSINASTEEVQVLEEVSLAIETASKPLETCGIATNFGSSLQIQTDEFLKVTETICSFLMCIRSCLACNFPSREAISLCTSVFFSSGLAFNVSVTERTIRAATMKTRAWNNLPDVFVPEQKEVQVHVKALPMLSFLPEFLLHLNDSDNACMIRKLRPRVTLRSATGSGKTIIAIFGLVIAALCERSHPSASPKCPYVFLVLPRPAIVEEKFTLFKSLHESTNAVRFVTGVGSIRNILMNPERNTFKGVNVLLATPYHALQVLHDVPSQIWNTIRLVLDEAHERPIEMDALLAKASGEIPTKDISAGLMLMSATPDDDLLHCLKPDFTTDISLATAALFEVKMFKKEFENPKDNPKKVGEECIHLVKKMAVRDAEVPFGHILAFLSGFPECQSASSIFINYFKNLTAPIQNQDANQKCNIVIINMDKNMRINDKKDSAKKSQYALVFEYCKKVIADEVKHAANENRRPMEFIFIWPMVLTGIVSYAQKNLAQSPLPHELNQLRVIKIIFANHIIESSITLEGLSCMIDGGLYKQIRFLHERGVTTSIEMPISASSAKQRLGRVGRVGPGYAISFTYVEHITDRRTNKQIKNPVTDLQFSRPPIELVDPGQMILKLRLLGIKLELIEGLPTPMKMTVREKVFTTLIHLKLLDPPDTLLLNVNDDTNVDNNNQINTSRNIEPKKFNCGGNLTVLGRRAADLSSLQPIFAVTVLIYGDRGMKGGSLFALIVLTISAFLNDNSLTKRKSGFDKNGTLFHEEGNEKGQPKYFYAYSDLTCIVNLTFLAILSTNTDKDFEKFMDGIIKGGDAKQIIQSLKNGVNSIIKKDHNYDCSTLLRQSVKDLIPLIDPNINPSDWHKKNEKSCDLDLLDDAISSVFSLLGSFDPSWIARRSATFISFGVAPKTYNLAMIYRLDSDVLLPGVNNVVVYARAAQGMAPTAPHKILLLATRINDTKRTISGCIIHNLTNSIFQSVNTDSKKVFGQLRPLHKDIKLFKSFMFIIMGEMLIKFMNEMDPQNNMCFQISNNLRISNMLSNHMKDKQSNTEKFKILNIHGNVIHTDDQSNISLAEYIFTGLSTKSTTIDEALGATYKLILFLKHCGSDQSILIPLHMGYSILGFDTNNGMLKTNEFVLRKENFKYMSLIKFARHYLINHSVKDAVSLFTTCLVLPINMKFIGMSPPVCDSFIDKNAFSPKSLFTNKNACILVSPKIQNSPRLASFISENNNHFIPTSLQPNHDETLSYSKQFSYSSIDNQPELDEQFVTDYPSPDSLSKLFSPLYSTQIAKIMIPSRKSLKKSFLFYVSKANQTILPQYYSANGQFVSSNLKELIEKVATTNNCQLDNDLPLPTASGMTTIPPVDSFTNIIENCPIVTNYDKNLKRNRFIGNRVCMFLPNSVAASPSITCLDNQFKLVPFPCYVMSINLSKMGNEAFEKKVTEVKSQCKNKILVPLIIPMKIKKHILIYLTHPLAVQKLFMITSSFYPQYQKKTIKFFSNSELLNLESKDDMEDEGDNIIDDDLLGLSNLPQLEDNCLMPLPLEAIGLKKEEIRAIMMHRNYADLLLSFAQKFAPPPRRVLKSRLDLESWAQKAWMFALVPSNASICLELRDERLSSHLETFNTSLPIEALSRGPQGVVSGRPLFYRVKTALSASSDDIQDVFKAFRDEKSLLAQVARLRFIPSKIIGILGEGISDWLKFNSNKTDNENHSYHKHIDLDTILAEDCDDDDEFSFMAPLDAPSKFQPLFIPPCNQVPETLPALASVLQLPLEDVMCSTSSLLPTESLPLSIITIIPSLGAKHKVEAHQQKIISSTVIQELSKSNKAANKWKMSFSIGEDTASPIVCQGEFKVVYVGLTDVMAFNSDDVMKGQNETSLGTSSNHQHADFTLNQEYENDDDEYDDDEYEDDDDEYDDEYDDDDGEWTDEEENVIFDDCIHPDHLISITNDWSLKHPCGGDAAALILHNADPNHRKNKLVKIASFLVQNYSSTPAPRKIFSFERQQNEGISNEFHFDQRHHSELYQRMEVHDNIQLMMQLVEENQQIKFPENKATASNKTCGSENNDEISEIADDGRAEEAAMEMVGLFDTQQEGNNDVNEFIEQIDMHNTAEISSSTLAADAISVNTSSAPTAPANITFNPEYVDLPVIRNINLGDQKNLQFSKYLIPPVVYSSTSIWDTSKQYAVRLKDKNRLPAFLEVFNEDLLAKLNNELTINSFPMKTNLSALSIPPSLMEITRNLYLLNDDVMNSMDLIEIPAFIEDFNSDMDEKVFSHSMFIFSSSYLKSAQKFVMHDVPNFEKKIEQRFSNQTVSPSKNAILSISNYSAANVARKMESDNIFFCLFICGQSLRPQINPPVLVSIQDNISGEIEVAKCSWCLECLSISLRNVISNHLKVSLKKKLTHDPKRPQFHLSVSAVLNNMNQLKSPFSFDTLSNSNNRFNIFVNLNLFLAELISNPPKVHKNERIRILIINPILQYFQINAVQAQNTDKARITFCPNHPHQRFITRKNAHRQALGFLNDSYKCNPCNTLGHNRITGEMLGLYLCSVCDNWHKQNSTDCKFRGKICPSCHVTTEKIDGCNHITCICGTHWCFLCIPGTAQAYKSGDDVYRHIRESHNNISNALFTAPENIQPTRIQREQAQEEQIGVRGNIVNRLLNLFF